MGDDGRRLHQGRARDHDSSRRSRTGSRSRRNGMIEDVAKLHLELVALAFACNFNRVATLQ